MDAIADEDEALGVRYSHPAWMVAAFREALKAHGYPEDELLDVLEADNEVPTVTLVARPSLMSVDELADEAEDGGQADDLAIVEERADLVRQARAVLLAVEAARVVGAGRVDLPSRTT